MDTIVPCHTKSKYVNGLATDITPCVGHALAQIKSCKLPKIPLMDTLHSTLKNQSNFETLTERNLSIFDFREHHGVVES
jgi:hypothetical protein